MHSEGEENEERNVRKTGELSEYEAREVGSSREQSRGHTGGEAGVCGGSLVQPNVLNCLNCF